MRRNSSRRFLHYLSPNPSITLLISALQPLCNKKTECVAKYQIAFQRCHSLYLYQRRQQRTSCTVNILKEPFFITFFSSVSVLFCHWKTIINHPGLALPTSHCSVAYFLLVFCFFCLLMESSGNKINPAVAHPTCSHQPRHGQSPNFTISP